MCAVPIVCAEYATGPARHATSATAAVTALNRRVNRAGIKRPIAATPPAIAITGTSHDSHDGARPSSAIDQSAVPTTPSASSARAANTSRRRHARTAPIATSAAIAGASATV